MRHAPLSPTPKVLACWQKGFKSRKMGKTSEMMSSGCKRIIAVYRSTQDQDGQISSMTGKALQLSHHLKRSC